MESGAAHLISLKVMRVSKPTLAQASQPFFSTSAALSAHATASLLSLQGTRPLPGQPKTLRDFSLTEVLTLPSTFGNISLGEIFTSAMCVNNESNMKVHGVQLKVEMQTATTKILLASFGGPDKDLTPNETVEAVTNHEVKELNQHVLACTVTYHLPETMIHLAGQPEDPSNPTLRVIRKFYKFTVSNPLSVKTKVHVPRSPSAHLSPTEREKVFLEVHVQNLTQDPLCFDRMRFECVEGWEAEDISTWSPLSIASEYEESANTPNGPTSVFSGATAFMQPMDTRQYLYILSPIPEATPPFPVIHQPGSIIPLGRLDISWRTGRLLTSVLSRRIPLLPVPAPAPAIPPHLIHQQQPSRPQSPGIVKPPSRSSSPAPFKARIPPSAAGARPQSPGPLVSPLPPVNPQFIPRPDIEVDLVLRNIDRSNVVVEKPFCIDFTLTLCTTLPSQNHLERRIRITLQHVLPPRPQTIRQSLAAATSTGFPLRPSIAESTAPPINPQPYTTRASASLTSLTSNSRRTGSLLSQWMENASSSVVSLDTQTTATLVQSPIDAVPAGPPPTTPKTTLPTPYREQEWTAPARVVGQQRAPAPEPEEEGRGRVTFIGSSSIRLPPFRISYLNAHPGLTKDPEPPRGLVSADFSLNFIPIRGGFTTVGGLRIIVVEDCEAGSEDEVSQKGGTDEMEPRILKEFDVLAEIWVKGS